jgi:hypothetical protein
VARGDHETAICHRIAQVRAEGVATGAKVSLRITRFGGILPRCTPTRQALFSRAAPIFPEG